MSWTSLDAWGQRENETPPVDKEETKEIKIELTFEYSSYDEHPSEWNWKRLLGVDWVDVEDWVDND
tara:strand:+ start:195 stop:392 length:198 start_codon:yes stop_codon:yes gene_type:complete